MLRLDWLASVSSTGSWFPDETTQGGGGFRPLDKNKQSVYLLDMANNRR